jgi:hypothetical protein
MFGRKRARDLAELRALVYKLDDLVYGKCYMFDGNLRGKDGMQETVSALAAQRDMYLRAVATWVEVRDYDTSALPGTLMNVLPPDGYRASVRIGGDEVWLSDQIYHTSGEAQAVAKEHMSKALKQLFTHAMDTVE